MAMLQIPSESVILRDTLRTRALRLAQPEQGGGKPLGSISVNLVEFDDVGYHLTANAAEPAKLLVSLALPPQPNKQVVSSGRTCVTSGRGQPQATMGATVSDPPPQPLRWKRRNKRSSRL